MDHVRCENAYYIKLGKKGVWEKRSIAENKARIGWSDQSIEDISGRNWAKIGNELRRVAKTKGTGTKDLNMLRTFVESTSEDIWVTFHDSCLWWCRLEEGEVEKDEISKYRRVMGKWSNKDIVGTILTTEEIPGTLAQTQGYRSTVCSIKRSDVLARVLNNQPSVANLGITKVRDDLISKVQAGLCELHWKNFETLIELLFSKAGWHRISRVGENMKYSDIVFEEPITKDLHQVQVKSKAELSDFESYAARFSSSGFRSLYFVVHTPLGALKDYQPEIGNKVELVRPERVAQMVVDLGLTSWLLKKIK